MSLLGIAEEAAEQVATSGNVATEYAWIIVAIPLLAVVLISVFGKRMPRGGAEIGIVGMMVGAVLSISVLSDFIGGGARAVHKAVEWFPFGDGLHLDLGMRVDGLTAIMFVVVTIVSLMVQIYSTGYMKGEPRFTWFFTALNLFTASMLIVVISDNLLQLLVGWELVGVCSYLLIGFYWEEQANSNAAIKAFVTTRIGDVPMVIGILLLFVSTGTFDISEILHKVEAGEVGAVTLTAAALLLFGGAIGKSAQFPLYVWLPDAMAGPTPVSALIHAATMVTAGVFLVARTFPIFESSQAALNVVALIGALTMLMAALLALVQDDIKKVLAYSTVSQLSYMVAALGVGAGNAGIFHLYTHAWFKALMFLGAGSVIHAVHSNNMSDMGGLKQWMPTTYKTFAIGTLAIAGIPPLAGFWSKDEILSEAFHFGTSGDGQVSAWVALTVFVVGVITAFLTAFYMSRAFHLTFEGEFRGHGHPHESPRAMTLPLQVLAGLSLVAGLVGIPWWKSGFGSWVRVGGEAHVPDANYTLIVLSILVGVVGLWLGRKVYLPAPAVDPVTKMGWFHKVLVNGYYLDDLYYKGIVYPIRDSIASAMYWLNQNVFDGAVNGAAATARASARGLYNVIDQKAIDGAVNGLGLSTRKGGGLLKFAQTGNIQRYAAVLFAGVAILAFLFTRFS